MSSNYQEKLRYHPTAISKPSGFKIYILNWFFILLIGKNLPLSIFLAAAVKYLLHRLEDYSYQISMNDRNIAKKEFFHVVLL